MGDRIVYYGPINNSKKNCLINKAKSHLLNNKGDRFYYILPNGKLIIKYRNLLLEDVVGAMDINLFTFDNMMDKLLKGKLYTTINSETKKSIIEKIIMDLKRANKLSYYKDVSITDGFIDAIDYIIGETKRSLITTKDYNIKAPNTPFYSEIGLIYEMYQQFLNENKLIDTEEAFFKGLELLKGKDDVFSNLDFIIIDDFFDFRPQEINVILEMLKYPMDIYINIPYKREPEFLTVVQTLNHLVNMGFKVEEVAMENKTYFESIGDILFTEKDYKIDKTDNIKIIKTANKYLEIKRIAQEIKALYTNGVELTSMGLVLTNQSEYLKVLHDVFNEEGIPYSLREEIRLIDVPLIRELLNIVKVKIFNFDKNSIVNRVKNTYFNIYEGRDKDKVEYILNKLSYGNIDELKAIVVNELNSVEALLATNLEDNNIKDKFEWLNYVDSSLNLIVEETNSIIDSGTPEEIINSLKDLINNYLLELKILEMYNKTNDFDIFYRDMLAISKLNQVLLNMAIDMSYVYDNMDINEFYEILLSYLEVEMVAIRQENVNGIDILTTSNLQGSQYDVLFITGLIDGKYPALKESNFFFNDDRYKENKFIGFNIKNYYERLDKESLLFVIAVTRCKELLYLSYPESSERDDVNIPSMFLDEMTAIFDGEKIDEILVNMDYLIKDNNSEITTEREYIQNILYKYFNGEEVKENFLMYNDIDEEMLNEINRKIECEVERAKDECNIYSGKLEDEKISEDILEIQNDTNYSISYFETYGKCPYKFLMEYILKLEGMERFVEDFSPLDRGNIFHKVLKDYYVVHQKDIINHVEGKGIFAVEDTSNEIEGMIEDILINNHVKLGDKLWKLRIESMTNSILELVKMDLDRLVSLNMVPIEFELPFGYRGDFTIPVNGQDFNIVGKIDRIDKVLNGDKYVLYDYKSSSYGIRKIKDILLGISFQLPVYIMSQGSREIIGSGYIIINDGIVSMEMVREEEMDTLGIKRKGKYVLNEEKWNELMLNVVDTMKDYLNKIFNGDFSINPKYCDGYCNYKDICRYNSRG